AVVWSLLPHQDAAAKQRLQALSPRLLTSLDQGLLAINYDMVERQTLAAALRQAHMQLLQGQDTRRQAVTATAEAARQPVTSLPSSSPLIKQMMALVVGQWLELGAEDEA